MKKLLSLVLVFALVLGLTPMVLAVTGLVDDDDIAYPVEGGNIYFDKATGSIMGADTSVTSADIPAMIENVAVKTIWYRAFNGCKSLTSVTIPNSVTRIQQFAFATCESLTSVTIPNSVTEIWESAFSGCKSLTSVSIPRSVTAIERAVFYGCDALTNITIPNNITKISDEAFSYCTSLTNITIPDSVTTIGTDAFASCTSLTNITIPCGVTYIGMQTFYNCDSLININIPDSVATIGNMAFGSCDSLTNITIPDSVTMIAHEAFYDCKSLKSVTIPSSVNKIEDRAFVYCNSLIDIYFGGTEARWKAIGGLSSGYDTSAVTVHYNSYPGSTGATPTAEPAEYVYNAADPAEDMTLPTEALDKVTNTTTATSAVNTLTSEMTAAQKTSATGTDLATLYAETAVSKAASKEVSSNEIIINAAAVKELEATAASTAQAVETALVNGGVSTGRYIANTVTLTTEQTGKITIKVDPDILTTKVDKIRVETPKYALTLKVSDLKADLSSIVTISAESMDVSESGSYALGGTAGSTSMRTVVALDLPGGHTTNSVTLSFPSANSSGANEAVVNESGAASSSKYNPATVTMDGKVNTSGKYTVKSNEKDFTDIANKSAEMQNAIRYLASKGIINGTSETTFSPDGSISRAEIAALIVRALGKLDSTATASFTDVTTADWYYSAAASSQKNGIINGYSDNTFKGKNPIIKQEIVAVAARVLKNEMNYKEPANTQTYLAKYSDTVAGWAQPEVALATRENLIVYRVDGTFSGAKNMTRGDAAIIIYRLFQHIW